jgi:hypothetical protein
MHDGNGLTRKRGLAAWMAALAVLLRVLVPAGFMIAPPDQAHAGMIPIVLCTGKGNVNAFLAPDGTLHQSADTDDGDPGEHDPGLDQHGDCIFAHAVTAPATPDLPAAIVPVPEQPPVLAGPLRLDLVPGRGLAAPPPPSTAPPTLI